MRMRFYIKGLRNKGVVEVDMKQVTPLFEEALHSLSNAFYVLGFVLRCQRCGLINDWIVKLLFA